MAEDEYTKIVYFSINFHLVPIWCKIFYFRILLLVGFLYIYLFWMYFTRYIYVWNGINGYNSYGNFISGQFMTVTIETITVKDTSYSRNIGFVKKFLWSKDFLSAYSNSNVNDINIFHICFTILTINYRHALAIPPHLLMSVINISS